MGTKLAKAEIAGAEGNVEESLKLMAEVEELKKSKAHAEVCFSDPTRKICLSTMLRKRNLQLTCSLFLSPECVGLIL